MDDHRADPAPPRRVTRARTARDDALARLSRTTRGLAVLSVTATGGLSAYVAHSLPGHRTPPLTARPAPPPGASPGTTAAPPPTAPTTTAPATTAPVPATRVPAVAPRTTTALTPPTTTPYRSYSAPQVVSGSTRW